MRPVTAAQHEADGKRVTFLRELLGGANASLAAARANLGRGTVYRWKLEDAEFADVWAEIVATRPRARHLRRRVLGRRRHSESSQLASHGTTATASPEAAWDNDFGPVWKVR